MCKTENMHNSLMFGLLKNMWLLKNISLYMMMWNVDKPYKLLPRPNHWQCSPPPQIKGLHIRASQMKWISTRIGPKVEAV